MQIHELNNYTGDLQTGYVAIDNGEDTGKLLATELTKDVSNQINQVDKRIDDIIAGEAPSAAEITDARTGVNGTVYTSLGTAIRSQVGDLYDVVGLSNQGLATFDKSLFVPGHLQLDGQVVTNGNNKRRCASDTIFEFDYPITFHIKSGFRIALDFYNEGDDSTVASYKTNLEGEVTYPANTRFKIEIYRVTEDTSEIADVNEFVDAAPFTSEFANTVNEMIAPVYIVPELRNGTFGNSGNLNFVVTKYVIPTKGAKYIYIKPDDILTDEDNDFYFFIRTYASSGQLSSDRAYLYEWDPYTLNSDRGLLLNVENCKGVGVALSEYTPGNQYVPHRIATDGNCMKFYYIYNELPVETVALRNGSLGSPASAYSMATRVSLPIPEGVNSIGFAVEGDINIDDLYFVFDVWTYSAESVLSYQTSNRVQELANYATNSPGVFTINLADFDASAKSFAVGIAAYNKATGQITPLRWTNRIKATLRYSILPEGLSYNAYERNRDKDDMLAAAVRYNKVANNSKDFCFLEITDSHNDKVAEKNSVLIANGFQYVDSLIHCGDFCADSARNYNAAEYAGMVACQKPFYFVIGNHDVGNRKTVADTIDNQTAFTRYIQPLINAGYIAGGEYVPNEPYYYHDFDDYNIRLIVVNEYDDPLDLDPNDSSQYIINRGYSVIQQDQAEWFCNTLDSTPDGYSVIVAMHQTFSSHAITDTAAKFNQSNLTGDYGLQRLFNTDFWADAVNAFVNRTSYTCEMVCTGDAAYLNGESGYYYTFTHDFSDAIGSFMCFLGGHIHRDCIWKHDVYTYQKQISPVCANTINYAQAINSDIRRTVSDSPSKDSLTAIGFDTDNKIARLVKIGVNVTENMTYRDIEALDLTE